MIYIFHNNKKPARVGGWMSSGSRGEIPAPLTRQGKNILLGGENIEKGI